MAGTIENTTFIDSGTEQLPRVTTGRFGMIAATPDDLPAMQEAARRAATALTQSGSAAFAKSWLGFRMSDTPRGMPEFSMVAVSALAADRDELTSAWAEATTDLVGPERYDVEVEPVRATGAGWGVTVDSTAIRPLGPDEPVMTVITGDVYPEHLEAFVAAAAPAVAQAYADPAYLGGCGLVSDRMVDITSVSCWTSAQASRAYAYRAGAHRSAKDVDEANGWHDLPTAFFVTYRVLSSSGTLLGIDPFARA
ncbi:MAG TPA: hypothetical protein VM345_12540 [Acidimicrobiales bacterium]|nr:hypothetical protein [Acidimicrobiales bacterium]